MHYDPTINRLIHENYWTVLSYAISQPEVRKLVAEKYAGDWKYLNKTVYYVAELLAGRALLELATLLRMLDDQQNIGDKLKDRGAPSVGNVLQVDGEICELYLRDMTNKIIHAQRFEWDFDEEDPKVTVYPYDSTRWQHAQLDVLRLAPVIGVIMH